MNYINKGKTDILIFPKFENVEKIQDIRKEYDELYGIIPPHITLAFPFKKEISNEELKERLEELFKNIKPFKISCKGTTISEDKKIGVYYIFLNIVEGKEIIKEINKKIYTEILNKPIIENYEPHITLGTTNNIDEKIELDEEFETIVDSIVVESIGENEESIIEFETSIKPHN